MLEEPTQALLAPPGPRYSLGLHLKALRAMCESLIFQNNEPIYL